MEVHRFETDIKGELYVHVHLLYTTLHQSEIYVTKCLSIHMQDHIRADYIPEWRLGDCTVRKLDGSLTP